MRFYGEIGYGESTETSPGVWVDVITERPYRGDVIRNTRKLDSGEQLNSDISVNNSISVVADEYVDQHFFEIKYVVWQGQRWVVTSVEVRSPRLILNLGGLYNGPTP